MNRWRSVPVAGTDLGPLRRVGRGELTLAAGVLAAAAILGTLPPPASGLPAPLGLSASGSDFGTTARVQLTAASDQPGPNRFVVRALDYDSGQPVPANRVSLRFTPLDDPGVEPSTLSLTRAADNSWEGSGANLAFAGRWQVTALVERDGDAVEAPMEIETRSPPPFVSILRVPGQPPEDTVQVKGAGHVRFSPRPERAGRSEVVRNLFRRDFRGTAYRGDCRHRGRRRRSRAPAACAAAGPQQVRRRRGASTRAEPDHSRRARRRRYPPARCARSRRPGRQTMVPFLVTDL